MTQAPAERTASPATPTGGGEGAAAFGARWYRRGLLRALGLSAGVHGLVMLWCHLLPAPPDEGPPLVLVALDRMATGHWIAQKIEPGPGHGGRGGTRGGGPGGGPAGGGSPGAAGGGGAPRLLGATAVPGVGAGGATPLLSKVSPTAAPSAELPQAPASLAFAATSPGNGSQRARAQEAKTPKISKRSEVLPPRPAAVVASAAPPLAPPLAPPSTAPTATPASVAASAPDTVPTSAPPQAMASVATAPPAPRREGESQGPGELDEGRTRVAAAPTVTANAGAAGPGAAGPAAGSDGPGAGGTGSGGAGDGSGSGGTGNGGAGNGANGNGGNGNGGTGNGGDGGGDPAKAWMLAVRAAVAAHKVYPEEARRRRSEARVVVRFEIDATGGVRVIAASGTEDEALLEAARAAVRAAAPLPLPPPEVGVAPLTIEVPLLFQLRRRR